ncbi:MAG TPA: heparan-alpha-glucosaminide N-acetyltransferase domain-containing protein, partial [Polyangiales bacterium]
MQRLPFVDWARGFAVVAMVLWHSGDAWLRPELHAGEGFFFLRFVGGLAAPSFLLLAGMGVGLGARPAKSAEEAGSRARTGAARGAEIVVLGYALRLQTWLVDAAAITQLHTLRAWFPLLLGYVGLFVACRRAGRGARGAGWLALGAASLAVLGLLQVGQVSPGRLTRLLQVDVLQAIGASLVLLALGERWLRWLQRPALLLGIGVAVACVTQPVGLLLPGGLPVPLAAYLARFPPAQGDTLPA